MNYLICILVVCSIPIGYLFVPNFIARRLSPNVIKTLPQVDDKKMIALTFDDGPDPRYTGKVLDILKIYGVKATFFIVALKAENCMDLIERMNREGHQLAMHSYSHKSAWLTTPQGTIQEFHKTLEIFKRMNIQVHEYRPPWGTFNAWTKKCAESHQLKAVLWSINAADWSIKQKPEDIASTIVSKTKSNDIIVLHDSGGHDTAPLNTIAALHICIPQLQAKGFQFVRIEEGLNHEYS